MIYSLVGTDTLRREKAYRELASLGPISVHIYSEQIAALKPLVEARSLFGEKIVANLIQTMDVAGSRDVVVDLLGEMQTSENIFIIDEPLADTNRVKRLEKYSTKTFDAREDKVESSTPFALCNAFARRDKKQAWLEWMKLRDTDSAEAIQGALWWKMKTIWEDTKSGKATKFSEKECELFASRIIRASLDAHRGEKDLKVELESIVLGV